MRNKRLVVAGASLLAATLAFSACGQRSTTGENTGGNTETKTAKIGVIAPLSGDLSSLGLGIQNSVDLAIKQANESNAIPGWKLEIAAEDDEAKPDVGKNAATKLAGDDDVVAVVGTLNSSVAQSVQPVLSSANITQVSPANTNPTLTQGANPAAKSRPYKTYFRTCTTDAIQGPFAARYLYTTAGLKKVATVHDKKAYGQGLVEAFSCRVQDPRRSDRRGRDHQPGRQGLRVGHHAGQERRSPEALYYGGEFPQSGPLSQQAKAAGLTVPLMGGDGMYSANFIKLAGKTSEGDLATSVGAPTDTLPSAKAFVDAYAAAGYKEPFDAYGAYSFDAANAIINALKVSLKDAADAEVGAAAHGGRHGERVLRRSHRQGRLRRVRRHDHQGADRLQGRGWQVGSGEDRGVQVT